MNKSTKLWVITEGLRGTENQCLGVANALDVEYTTKVVHLNQPWKKLSPYLGFEMSSTFSPPLEGPWPDILITSGRKAIAASRYIKKNSGGKTFTVHIQDPRIPPNNFDLVAVPEHDPTRGHNVIVTTATPNMITTEKLAAGKAAFPQFADMPGPRIAVLIGGNSQAYTFEKHQAEKLASDLKAIDGSLLITTSRRTGEENERIIRETLKDRPNTYIWDGGSENPYFGILGWADVILVTADSTSMISEAGTTGKPVYIVPITGGRKRMSLFHDNLVKRGAARFFEGQIEQWNYEPLNDAALIANEIKKRIKL